MTPEQGKEARMQPRDTGATPALLRRLNAGLILNLLRAADELSVSELAMRTDLSRPTVDAAIMDLVRLGLVAESGADTARGSLRRRGRPARRYRFRATAGHVLGIDIGEEEVRVAVTDLRGSIVAERVRTVEVDLSRRRRLRAVLTAAHGALRAARIPAGHLLAVAAASPGVVDPATEQIVFCKAMPEWTDFDLGAVLRPAFDCRVLVENDANLAAVGECWQGVAQDCDDVLFFLLGTRIGAGIVVNGRLVRGHRGGAGELGFLDLWEETRTTRGEIAAGAADAVADLVGWGPRRPSRASLRQPDDRESLSWGTETRPVIEAALSNDHQARSALERFLANAGYASVTIALLLSPELIVVGGGTAADDVLIDPLRLLLERLVRGRVATPPRLEASTLGARAVMLGAVRHALEDVESRLLETFYASASQTGPGG
jgi:predicted NBD/HSP70 family sugar kinase